MPTFVYKARSSSGAVVGGEIEADNVKAAKFRLADQGLFPMDVSEKGRELKVPEFFKKKLNPKDLMAFTRQFATLFKAGVPMDRIFLTLSRQVEHKEFKKTVEEIRMDVARGSSLMNAFGKHPRFFNDLYINMLNVGEQGGSLEVALMNLSAILEKDYTITSRTKSATLYPKIVVVVFIGVLILMLTFVIPRLTDFYRGFKAELPLPTRIVTAASDICVNYWYLVLIAAFLIFLAYRKYASTEGGRLNIDRLRLAFPVFGRLNVLVANARFGHLASALYRSGVPLVRTLSVVARAIGNKAYNRQLDMANEEVKRGSTFAAALDGKKYFTPIIVESVAVGEQSGSLDDMLEITAKFYDDEASSMLGNLTTLIEPLLLVGLFGMVLLLALAVLLPIWKISSVVLPGGGS